MKIVQLRVLLAVDDGVEMGDVKGRLRAAIVSKETETLEENGTKRIHWGTADVLQGPERVPSRAQRTSKGKEAPT